MLPVGAANTPHTSVVGLQALLIIMWLALTLLFQYLCGYCSAHEWPGWGFISHGGFPPIPWASWQLNQSTTAYFLGNQSGMDNSSELAKEVSLGYVGIGWQLNNIPSNYSHLERFEAAEAARLKSLRPDVRVGVLRNTEVAAEFWDVARARMHDPATQDFWTMCGDAPCSQLWAGTTLSYWFNFSNPHLVDWWVNVYIGGVVNSSGFDGIYFDCQCDSAPGVPQADEARFQADTQAAFDRALALISSAGKWASSWNTAVHNGYISRGNCQSVTAQWIVIGADATHALQIKGAAFQMPSVGVPDPREENNTIAAFLISRGASAMMMIGSTPMFLMDRFDYAYPLLNADFGVPVGPATVNGTIFTRDYSNARVTLDCGSWSSTFAFR